ncbi:NucA/NucB deoxyribonuclease domain-containing protein [Couchioplanes azureus]|uniref:NucA/NucB deoxyribonuclease domain-containing protein n=1 Tax=Couchioplanes caeruleus TaxID=56438 RepID=UPI001670CF40|nr:hypothetical protein [Couchioplanes caeruleus]GGQ83496.1 hypothetical protein GCM10010166_62050 [Couchioplanes caeruleus subsp. azureus]
MRTFWKRLATAVTVITAMLAAATPALAAPQPTFAWVVTSSEGAWPSPKNAAPQTNSNLPEPNTAAPSGSTRFAPLAELPGEHALRDECVNAHADAARHVEGWMKDRFNRCYMGHRKIELRCVGCTIIIASVEFDYVLLGMTSNGTRQADFVLTFHDWDAKGGVEREITPMRVSLGGCGTYISCNPGNAETTQPLGGWETAPRFHATFTSAEQTGVGDEFRALSTPSLGLQVIPVNPEHVPYVETNMTRAEVRFDSAGARAGKHHGAVFSDFTPTFDLVKIAQADHYEDGVKESILHIEDALYRPIRTFPSFVGKTIPGRYDPAAGANQYPLHRLVDSNLQSKNRTTAGKVCDDVWGPDGRTPDLNCDEYPFASTKEGAFTGSTVSTGTADGWRTWRGSSRLIGEVDNQDSGRQYLNVAFYQGNRILSDDPFFVEIDRSPSS